MEVAGHFARRQSGNGEPFHIHALSIQDRTLFSDGHAVHPDILVQMDVDIVHGLAIVICSRAGSRMDIVSAQYFDDPSVVEPGRRPFVRGKIHLIGHITHTELSPILSLPVPPPPAGLLWPV